MTEKQTNIVDEQKKLWFLDDVLSASHLVCGSIGIPLNLLIAIVIIFHRRLHKPRNICWLGVTFSNILVLVVHLTELYAARYQDLTACIICVSLFGVPYASLLLNLLLSLVDRYVAISYPVWHKVHVHAGGIVKVQIFSFAVLWAGMKAPYLLNVIPLQCRKQYLELHFLAGVINTLLGLCFIAQIIAYIKTRKCLAAMLADENARGTEMTMSVMGENIPSTDNQTSTKRSSQSNHRDFFVHANQGNISKKELEVTLCVLRGVISLCLFALPFLISNGFLISCMQNVAHDCNSQVKLHWYLKELLLVHSVYNPCIYIAKSPDFSAIVCAKLSNR